MYNSFHSKMITDPGFVKLAQIISGLAAVVPATQHNLDLEYEQTLADFAAIVAFAAGTGLTDLARDLFPARPVISDVDIKASLAAGQTRSESFEIGFRVVNAGYHKTFQSTQKTFHSLRIEVAAFPFPPGPPDEEIDSPPQI